MSPHGPLALLAALTFARVAYGVQFQSVGAVGPAIVAELDLAYASLGTLVGAYSALGLALSLPAGWLAARLGERRVVLAGLGLMAAGGALLAGAPDLGAAFAGRLVSGAGAMLLMVALPTVVAGRFAAPALPAAMGTLLAGYPLGIGLGSVVLPLLGSWRVAMAATAVLVLAALVAAAPALPKPRGAAAAAVPRRHRPHGPSPREAAAVAAAGLVWGFPNAGFVTLLGFAPGFFAGRGVAGHLAAALAGLVAFATVPVGPFGGWLLGGLKRPSLGVAAGIALVAISTALLARGLAPVVLLVAAGVALGTVSGPIVALPAAVLAPERRAVGMGLFWTVFFVPMALLPPLAGLARDLTGDAAAPLGAAAVFAALGLPALAAHAWLRRPAAATVPGGARAAP
jgi:MFS family permease